MAMTQDLSRDQMARAARAAGVPADASMPETISVPSGFTGPPTGRW